MSILALKKCRPKPVYVSVRSLKHYNKDSFCEDISNVSWSVINNFEDVNDCLNSFDLLFNEILDQHAPIRKVKVRTRPNPFVTEEIRGLIKTRDRWRKLARKTGDPAAWSAYRNCKRDVKRELRMAQRSYVEQEIRKNTKDTGNMWKVIRTCIPKKSTGKKCFSSDDKSVANNFNQFFTSVGSNTVTKIKSLAKENNYTPSQLPFVPRSYTESEQFTFEPVECSLVEYVVKSMPDNKAPGIDKIPIRVIKDCLPVISPWITSIINNSLANNIFPNTWKIAEVTPIPKEGDHELANNNRPISLLPVLSKVCERVALHQLTSYLTTNHRLSVHQSGNKTWHSTETSLIHSTDSILKAIDQKKVTAVILLDMSKAFDSINHNILLAKLEDVGVSSTCLAWFKSYLSERYQAVRINSTLSEKLPVVSGVPQGSILGPLLFSIYVNDLPSAAKKCSSESYVDDTKLLLSFRINDSNTALTDLNEDLIRMRNWCFDNLLLLNPDKTKLMVYGSRQMLAKLPDFRLSLLGKELTPASSVKDLGVKFDPILSFDNHILSTVSSCKSSLCQINRAKHVFSKNLLITVINALVFSKLYYCSSLWSNTSCSNLSRLQGVQNFAARVVSNRRKFDHITPILKELRWFPVKSHLYSRDALLAFKCMNDCAPAYLSSQFKTRGEVSGRDTRNTKQLDVPLYRSTAGQRTFHYRTVTLWNNINPDLKLCKSIPSFKTKLKRELLQQFIDS